MWASEPGPLEGGAAGAAGAAGDVRAVLAAGSVRAVGVLCLTLVFTLALPGCAVVTVAGAVTGAAISVAGAVVSTGVKVTGKVIEKTVDAVTPDAKPAQ